MFQTIKQDANLHDGLAEVVVLHRQAQHTVPPMVYSVMRVNLSWEQIWSTRPEHLSATGELVPFALESPNTVQQEDNADARNRYACS